MSRTSRIPQLRVLWIGALVMALTAAFITPSAAGPVGFQATGGWYTESDDFFLGAGARMGAGTITVIPNAEYLFVTSGSAYTLNVDATMSLMPLGVANVYAGAGIGWVTTDPEQGDSHTDSVVNLIAGAGLNALPLKPFAQFKWVVADGNDPLQFAIGARF